jgi:hypothetical protein
MALGLSAFVQAREIQAVRAGSPPIIDGKLDDACWKNAKPITDFIRLGTNYASENRTTACVTYDDTHIYVGVKCIDSDTSSIKLSGKPAPKGMFTRKRDADVFKEDSVEIFINPWGSGSNFYHLIIGASGAEWACSNSGGAMNESWDGDWQAATFIGDGYWSCEVAIPYYTLGLDSRVGSSWTMNIGRNRNSPHEQSSLADGGAFVAPDKFLPLTGLNVDLKPFFYALGDPKVAVEKRGDKYLASVELPILNQTGKDKNLDIDFTFSDAGSTATERSGTVPVLSGKQGVFSFSDLPVSNALRHEAECDLVMRNHGTNQIIRFSRLSLPVEYKPLDARIVHPSYRDTIYATQDLKMVEVQATANVSADKLKGSSVCATLKDSSGAIIQTVNASKIKNNTFDAIFSAGKLKTGRYSIDLTLYDRTGGVVASVRKTLTKAAPFKGEVRIDEDLNLVVDGKPFFPDGYFGESDPKIAARDGCNSSVTYGHLSASRMDDGKAFLDDYWASGIRLFISPYPDGKRADSNNDHLSKQTADGITAIVNAFKTHPGILGWYMCDEPENHDESPLQLQEAYELVKKLDPYHPCLMVNDSRSGLHDYHRCADIFMPDPYPLFTKKTPFQSYSILEYASYIDTARSLEPQRPAWVTPEAFDYGDFADYDNHTIDRAPTFKEYRAMVYLAVIHGVKGFEHYARPYAMAYPDLRLGMQSITRELNCLSPVLLSPKQTLISRASKATPVEVLLKVEGGNQYLFAVNTAPDPATVTLKMPAGCPTKFYVLNEGREVSVKAGVLSDQFEGYGTHVYASVPMSSSLTIEQVQSEIDRQNAKRRKPGNLAFWLDNDVLATSSSAVDSTMYGHYYANARMTLRGLGDEEAREAWMAKTVKGTPDWIKLEWKSKVTIGKVMIDGMTLRDFDIQYWDGKDWKTAMSVRDNEDRTAIYKIDPVQTDKLRLWITNVNGPNAIISELECYAK